MNKKKIAILGGGVSGITLAKELSKCSSLEVDLIERSSELGGFHRNFQVDDLKYDIGTFTFGYQHNLFKVFPDIVDLYKPIINNFGSVTQKNTLDNFPCTLGGYLRNYGLTNFLITCLEIPVSKFLYRQKNTVPNFVKYYLGASAYEKTGLKNYIERLYQVSDETVNIKFAKKRLSWIEKKASIRRIVTKKLTGKKSRLSMANKPRLVRSPEGFKKIYGTIHNILLNNGVNVKLSCEAKAIRREQQKFEIEFSEESKVYDEVISTIPIPVVSKLIGKPMQKELETMSLLTLFYRFQGDLNYDYNVLHNFTGEGSWKRITTFSKYYGKHEGDDYFSVEITLDKTEAPDVIQQQREFEAHVKSVGLFEGQLKLQDSLLTKNAYPVYLNDNIQRITEAKDKLEQWGLRLVGRQGEFQYVNSSDAVGDAIALAKKLKQDYH